MATDPRRTPATSLPARDDDDIAAAVAGRFPATVVHESHGQPVVYVERTDWHDMAQFLRDDQQFSQCADVTAVDHLVDAERAAVPGVAFERFEVVANFLSHARNRRLRAICEVPEADPNVASITDLYPGANFAEREVFDLFGVVFDDHPDLARLVLPDDWIGHPLRKDDAPGRIPVEFKDDPAPR